MESIREISEIVDVDLIVGSGREGSDSSLKAIRTAGQRSQVTVCPIGVVVIQLMNMLLAVSGHYEQRKHERHSAGEYPFVGCTRRESEILFAKHKSSFGDLRI